MLPSDDPHSPAFADHRQELLVLLALGEPVDEWFDSHQRTCPSCQRDLSAYFETVTLARLGEGDGQRGETGPPASVWAGIATQLGLDDRATTRLVPTPHPMPSAVVGAEPVAVGNDVAGSEPTNGRWTPGRLSGRWRAGLAAAAAVVAVGIGVGIGAAVTHNSGSTTAAPQILSQAALVNQPGGPNTVSGAARVHTSPLGLAISVDTSGLPLRHGYYQVWLYDPAGKHMLPVGALNDDGRGTFTVPAGVDLRTYDVVDVSAQEYDGNYEHEQSVLRGPLTQ